MVECSVGSLAFSQSFQYDYSINVCSVTSNLLADQLTNYYFKVCVMGCRTVSSGNKITNCGSCGEVLLGDAIKVAANLHYHIHCFTCSECGCELVNTGFFTKVRLFYYLLFLLSTFR